MTGSEYLEDIRSQLKAGRRQHRMGENVLRAFGYVRRRATAIEEINTTMKELGLVAEPPISAEMPLRVPRIIFSLRPAIQPATPETVDEPDTPSSDDTDAPLEDAEDSDVDLLEPAFSVSELKSATADVECVRADASIQHAYTTMCLHKYSQLVVANSSKPRQQDIKGVVSFQSMAKALMNGSPNTVGDCTDNAVPIVPADADLNAVIDELSRSDVVLVLGKDKRLQGIVTAWDLAEEFADLVDPFKRIGEIEQRLRALVKTRLGEAVVASFRKDHGLSVGLASTDIDALTMGVLERVIERPEQWNSLQLPFDRVVFIGALREVRDYRNRLVHFRDPLNDQEKEQLTNFCDLVREIQL